MNPAFFAPKGTKDILPDETPIWTALESAMRGVCKNFAYKEIRTPEFESTGLFIRGVGDSTDIVQKEMYTFTHRDKESFTLKPEMTASVVRAYIENGMASYPQPVKLFYIARCFRCENPQKGRQRQFNQFGIEAFGSNSPLQDAEVISVADSLFKSLGIKNIKLEINSVGCPECRAEYYKKLRSYLADYEYTLCDDCQKRLVTNPMRVFDCKKDAGKKVIENAPRMIDNLCEDCNTHFSKVKSALTSSGLGYVVNPNIVRGLDYYTNTAFEFISDDLGAQSTVCGGGRYNELIESLGGEPTPGVGFALGIERLILIMKAQNLIPSFNAVTDLYIASLGDEANDYALLTAGKLRESGYSVSTDTMERSLKAQMKYADKLNSRYVLIIGEEEINSGTAKLRNMDTKEQTDIDLKNAYDILINFLDGERL